MNTCIYNNLRIYNVVLHILFLFVLKKDLSPFCHNDQLECSQIKFSAFFTLQYKTCIFSTLFYTSTLLHSF